MFNVLRFWLDRGVDGFRVDVLWLLIKDATFRDNPPNPSYRPAQPGINRYFSSYNSDQPEVHEVVAQMRSVLDEYTDRVLIGEVYLPLNRLVAYYGRDLEGAHLPFNFALVHAAWNAKEIGALITDYEKALPRGGWPNWVLGNHDQPRIAARVGASQARNAAMLLLTLRGTPTLYYGDEIGLGCVEIPPDLMRDPWERNEPGLGLSRDPWRTPFQWDASPSAGFTTGRPWLPIDADYRNQNVEKLQRDSRSLLTLYRYLINLRKRHRALNIGGARVLASDGDVLSYERFFRDERIIVSINFARSDRPANVASLDSASLLLSTLMDREVTADKLILRAGEGVILRID
jgi:alpha-glucosidase